MVVPFLSWSSTSKCDEPTHGIAKYELGRVRVTEEGIIMILMGTSIYVLTRVAYTLGPWQIPTRILFLFSQTPQEIRWASEKPCEMLLTLDWDRIQWFPALGQNTNHNIVRKYLKVLCATFKGLLAHECSEVSIFPTDRSWNVLANYWHLSEVLFSVKSVCIFRRWAELSY